MSSDNARDIKTHLDEWLRRFDTAKRIAPSVQQAREFADWQVIAYDALKADVVSKVNANVDQHLSRELTLLKRDLPLLPDYNPIDKYRAPFQTNFATTTSVASGTAALFDALLMEVGSYKKTSLKANQAIQSYERLQRTQGRITEARSRLIAHFPKLLEYFEQAETTYHLAAINPDDMPSAALAMRTLLDKLKGELFNKARHGTNENMTWATFAEQLARNEDARNTLLEEDERRIKLIDSLSSTLKKREASNSSPLSSVWPLVVDHIFIVCGSIKP